jgi:polyphosphate kinase
MLEDNGKAREQEASGHYHYVQSKEDEIEVNSQHLLCEMAYHARKSEIHENKSVHDLKQKIVRFGSLSISA